MDLRAFVIAGTAAGVALTGFALGETVIEDKTSSRGTTLTGDSHRRGTVAHWDGVEIFAGEEVNGLRDGARESVEAWRGFAEDYGYRIDVDESQRVVVVSDAERFQKITSTLAIVENVLDATEPFAAEMADPIILVRASSEDDRERAHDVVEGAATSETVFTMIEQGSRRERRAVEARLAETLVGARLEGASPDLSTWMRDGLASAISAETTGRALIDGEVETFRSVQSDVARRFKDAGVKRLDILEISGARPGEADAPLEAESMVLMAFLMKHYEAELPAIVRDLGRSREIGAKFETEERALKRHCGIAALVEIAEGMAKGRRYRPRR